MMLSTWKQTIALTGAVSILCVAPAAADQWNERSILTFSESVRVPGATLEPGSYVFELADPRAASDVIRIRNEKTSEIVTTVRAVPTKRTGNTSETVLRFNPTDQTEQAPVALRAWFYPNSLYGHQFVYDDKEARDIAMRSKTIVLTIDDPDQEGQSGKLMVYDQAGLKKSYSGDAATLREWEEWSSKREARASSEPDARAPVVRADSEGTKVTVDRLEDNSEKFIGQKVSVDAEVEDVYGPRLFTIDEPNWADLEGEIFVYMPSVMAVAVKEDDRVTVSGTVRQFVLADVEHEWGWLDLTPDVVVRLERRPILIADRIVGGDNSSVFVIESDAGTNAKPADSTKTQAAGSKPASNQEPITSIGKIGDDEDSLVGRRVTLSGVEVVTSGEQNGFIARQGGQEVFVLAPEGKDISAGKTVSIDGIVLRTPASMADRIASLGNPATDEVYVYATNVS